MKAKFITTGTPPKADLTNKTDTGDHYITEFKYGIVYGELKFEYIKSKSFFKQETMKCLLKFLEYGLQNSNIKKNIT